MEILIKIGVVFLITLFGMWGGQTMKWTRRYLIPIIATLYTKLKKEHKNKAFILLALIGILSMGYGVNSFLRTKICFNNDALTRIVYGVLLSIPFLILGNWYALILPIVFSIRAGGFKIGKYDFLWEDFWRYSTIGMLVVL